MKKPAILALAAAGVVLVAFPISAWLLGQRVEADVAEQYRLLADYPNIRVSQRSFQRGIFSSNETVTLEFSGINEFLDKYESAQNKESHVAPMPNKTLTLSFQTRYQHGPFPGFSTLAAATSESELVLDSEDRQAVRKLFGNQKPLQIRGIYHFDGSATTTIDSPPFRHQEADNPHSKGFQLVWQGMRISASHGPQLRTQSFVAELPGLEVGDNEGNRLELSGLKLSSNQQRLFDDEPLFQTGSMRLTLDNIDFHDYQTRGNEKNLAFTLQQLVFEANTPVNGDFMDILGKVGVLAVKFNGQEFGPAHYDFSLRHLHARTTARLYRAMANARSRAGQKTTENGEDNPLQALAKLREPLLELLKYSPEIRLDRVSFNSPQGEAKVSASASLGSVSAAEFDNPQQLLAKLRAKATLTLPENLLQDLTAEQLAELVERGFVERRGELLHTVISFEQGKITVNDKPFSPQMLAPPATPPGEDNAGPQPAPAPPPMPMPGATMGGGMNAPAQ